jgi:hypothetical protein
MIRTRAVVAGVCIGLFVAALAAAGPAGAVPPDPVDSADGKEWRQLYETTGISASDVAQVCARDGETPCSGVVGATDLTGWVWATAPQVLALMAKYEPALLSAEAAPTSDQFFGTAMDFLADMRWTGYVVTYVGYDEWTSGWTASTNDAGLPIFGTVGFGWWPPYGNFGVAAAADGAASDRGVFLWRPKDADHTGPVVTPTVTGTAGNNGWYVSDVLVSWTVEDAESAVTSSCDNATVTADTAETTLVCVATSAGGRTSASTVVRRDATAPTVTCGAAPVFQLGQAGASVTATVTDETSGAVNASTLAAADTSGAGTFSVTVTGTDRAGNTTTQQCSYTVVVPTCNGLPATRVGTDNGEFINGTSGRDVIVALGGADTINGNGGDDVICGGGGADTIDGGDGDDWIDGGADLDSIRGGSGKDTCTSGEIRMSSC